MKKYKLTKEQIDTLTKYKIDYRKYNDEDLLTEIFSVMHDYLDSNDNPKPEFNELESLYYELYSSDKHFYIYVEYYDDFDGKMYCYTSKDYSIKKDDIVLVERGQDDELVSAKVITTKYYTDDEAPYPFSKLKYVIRRLPQFLDDIHYNNWDNIDERIVARIIDETKYTSKSEFKKDAKLYNINNFNSLTEDEIRDIIIKKERNNSSLDQDIIDDLLNRNHDDLNLRLYYNKNLEIEFKNEKILKGHTISYTSAFDNDELIPSLLVESKDGIFEVYKPDIKNIKILEKAVCPNCNEMLADIIYGLPDVDAFNSQVRKEVYFGGCVIIEGRENPIYHCYNCNRNYFKDLKNYEEVEENDYE